MIKVKKAEHHKKLLREVILFMIRNKERRDAIINGYADFNYNFTNILAKYYNANDSCRISVEAYKILEKAGIMLPSSVKESKFSRQTFRGSATASETHTTALQKVKGEFIFDHNPPVNIIRKKILEVNKEKFDNKKTIKILEKFNDCVFMLTKNENKILNEKTTIIDNKKVSLNSNMPSEWKWEHKNADIRYNKCNIKITDKKIYFNTNKIPR